MFGRSYLGLEIGPQNLTAVSIKKRGKGIAWIDGQVQPCNEGILRPDFNQPNVKDPAAFVKALQQLLKPLSRGDRRIAVSLPDAAGLIFLLTLETPFKNRDEGAEMIRWQLKDQLPNSDSSSIALDYQVLEETEAGPKQILVATLHPQVLEQYEALIEQAGYAAALVDFHSLSLYNAYQGTLDLGQDFVFVAVAGCQLTLLAVTNRIPSCYRSRTITPDAETVFQELNRSLVKLRQRPGFQRLPVHLHSDWPRETVEEAVAGAFEQSVQWLSAAQGKFANGRRKQASTVDGHPLMAARGAAERLIQRVNR